MDRPKIDGPLGDARPRYSREAHLPHPELALVVRTPTIERPGCAFIVGDPQYSSTATRPRGAMLRAYDKMTGAQVGEVMMPAPISGSPMTYLHNGRQYIIVAVSGGNYTGEYISFALPQNMTTTTSAPRQ